MRPLTSRYDERLSYYTIGVSSNDGSSSEYVQDDVSYARFVILSERRELLFSLA